MKQSREEEVSRIGRNIRNARQRRGFSQEELAEKAEIYPQYISLLETGSRGASIDVYLKIANGLDISLSELFSEKQEKVDLLDADDIPALFRDASPFELRVMIAVLTAAKNALRSRG